MAWGESIEAGWWGRQPGGVRPRDRRSGIGEGDRELRRRGAPPPAPPRSFLTERGEFDCASAGIDLRPRVPPPGSHYSPTSPKTAGGGWGAEGSGLDGRRANCAGRGAPPPAPPRSFLTERGRIRSRFGWDRSASAGAPTGLALLAHLPQNCWGRLGAEDRASPQPATWQARASPGSQPVREGGLRVVVAANSFAIAGLAAGAVARRPTSNWRPRGAPPPAPPRSFLTERGEFDRASTAGRARHLSPAQFAGERPGEGGRPPSRTTRPESLRPPPSTPTSPSSFGGGGRVMRARRGRPPPARDRPKRRPSPSSARRHAGGRPASACRCWMTARAVSAAA
jgi:hypothetical protein